MNHSNPSEQDGHFFRNESRNAQAATNFLNTLSLPAVVRVLIAKGYLTYEEIVKSEKELHKHQEDQNWSGVKDAISDATEINQNFVRTYSSREAKSVKFRLLRKILGRYKWGRKIGSALFGWKWRRKTPENSIGASR